MFWGKAGVRSKDVRQTLPLTTPKLRFSGSLAGQTNSVLECIAIVPVVSTTPVSAVYAVSSNHWRSTSRQCSVAACAAAAPVLQVHRDSTLQSATPAYLLWLSCVSSAIATTFAVFNAPAPGRARSTSFNGRACSCTLSGVSVATARAVHAAPAAVAEYTS